MNPIRTVLVLLAVVVGHAETLHYAAAARGFGSVQVEARLDGGASWTTFTAEDAAHARIVGSKRLADLLGFGDLRPATTTLPGTLLELSGTGVWLLALDGNHFHELFAPDMAALGRLVAAADTAAWTAVPTRAYPRWLDCFDNAGPGIWFGGGGAPVDIDAEFPWMAERGLAYNFHPAAENLYVAQGVFDTSLTDWFGAMCAKYDIPFRCNYWEITKPSWYWNREPLPYVTPSPGRLCVKYGFGHELESLYRISYGSEPISASDPFTHDARVRFMGAVGQDPNFLGTMAVAEIGMSGVMLLGTIAEMPETRAYWQSYLVNELGFDLPKLGLAHHGRRDYYRSWTAVAVPTSHDFLGLDDNSIELAGDGWEGFADYDIEEYAEYAKAAAPPSPKPIPTEGWVPVASNDPMLWAYKGKQHSRTKFADYWLRREFTVPAEQLAGVKYLHVERPTKVRVKYGDAYLNGRPLEQVTGDRAEEPTVCFALGDALRVGGNQLVLRMDGWPPVGFIALGRLPLRPYPEMTRPENRRWYDATNFVTWLRMRGVEQMLQVARSVEPNRPLKMMALINHMDMAIPLAERYGAYVHDTGGASGYWCPFTGAKIARSHGLPWSVEQGGPPRDAQGLQSAITYNIMYGNDAIDMVFATTHYKDTPGVKEWFDENLELVKCFGKMHLPTPPIGMLFSARNLRLGFSEPMNWHLGRGPLQAVGRNFAQIELPDLDNGIVDQFPVILDCSTVQMSRREVAAIRRYVERGGIFVAQHNTARHLPDQQDAWPLAASLGLQVKPKWMSAENHNKWQDAEIKMSADQELFPSLAGKSFFGSGISINWLDDADASAVEYVPVDDRAAAVRPVATWAEDGAMAIAEARLGRGRVILLGTIPFTRMRDNGSVWVNAEDRAKLLDEFLTALGVPRESWTGDPTLWAQIWRSKNGVYDLYPVARIAKDGEDTVTAAPRLRRAAKVAQMVEVSALGHPRVDVAWADGVVTLPERPWDKMRARVYIAPRADIGRAAVDWFAAQADIWRQLPLLPDTARPQPIPVPADVIPLIEDWQATVADDEPRTVKLGTFVAMGIPEDATATFRKRVAVPAAWQGGRVSLCFRARRPYGVNTAGRLSLNGEPAAVPQPLAGTADFTLDVTNLAATGAIELALEVDGKWVQTRRQPRPGEGRRFPSGVTGVFFLEAIPAPVAVTPLNGPWFAATDVGVLTPVATGEEATYTYLETRFTLPADWPGDRLFLERPDGVELQHVILNNQAVTVPMPRLDISGLVRRDGANVLRWVPGTHRVPEIVNKQTMVIPELNLVWQQ